MKEETRVQRKWMGYLRERGWKVVNISGGLYQEGIPDLYCCHRIYGARWVEIKIARRVSFTPAQQREFLDYTIHGAHIWILTDNICQEEYHKLFGPANLRYYMKAS